MSEPIDVVDGTLPDLPEPERPSAKSPPPTQEQVLEKLDQCAVAAKAAIQPDKKPQKGLPGVRRTLAEVEVLRSSRSRVEKASKLTPITPLTPRTGAGFYLPEIAAEELINKAPEFGPETPPVKDDGAPPTQEQVETAMTLALPQAGTVPIEERVFNKHRAAMVLLDAFAMGDEEAAKKWGVRRGTVSGYRDRLATDPEFAKILSLRWKELEHSWSVARLQCLRSVIKRIETLAMVSEDIYRLSGAVKILGELQVVAGVLNGGSENPDSRASNEEDARRATRGPGPVFERLDK